MAQHYWAVKPITYPLSVVRIEKAATPRQAVTLAFGRPVSFNTWEAKDLGTRVSVIQSDRKRIALLEDRTGWKPVN